MFSVLIMTSLNITLTEIINDSIERDKRLFPVNYDAMVTSSIENKTALNESEKYEIVDSSTEEVFLGKCIFNDHEDINKRYQMDVYGCEENIEEFFNIKLLEGRYPKDDKEIVLEKWVLPSLGENLNVGDKIKLNLRISVAKGNENYFEEEYTIVGLIESQCNGKLSVAGTKAFVTNKFAEENNKVQSHIIKYYRFKEGENLVQGYNKLLTALDCESIKSEYNMIREYLIGAIKIFEGAKLICFSVISLISVVLIYNMFSITISLRMKEIGMLKALGAEKRHISLLLLGEGLITAIIFIPIGILLGCVGVEGLKWLTLKEAYNFNGLCITSDVIILSSLFSVLPVVLGSLICTKKLNKISSIEAMNYKESGKISNVKGDKAYNEEKKFYNFMAVKNLKRNKSKFINTVFSLSITIIMFMLVNYIINCSSPELKKHMMKSPNFIINTLGDSIGEEKILELEKLEGIEEVEYNREVNNAYIKIPNDKVTDEGKRYIKNMDNKILDKPRENPNEYVLKTENLGYSDERIEELKPLVLEGNINIDELKNNNKIILAQNLNHNTISKYAVGDKISIATGRGDMLNEPKEYDIVAILDSKTFMQEDMLNTTTIIMSYDTFIKDYGSNSIKKASVYLKNNSYYEEASKEINEQFDKNNYEVKDIKKEEVEGKKKNVKLLTLLYSFISVLAITSVFNVINIMYMNITSRKKEISMLRAIGMSKNEVKAMVVKEGFYYCIYSSIIGISLGTLSTYVFFQLTKTSFTTGMVWVLPIGIIIGIFSIMVLICLFSSLNACKGILDESIVEGVKAIE